MTRKRLYSSKVSIAIAWAVYLGCTTAKRLAREWGLTRAHASHRLRYAACAGTIERVGYGEYRSDRPSRSTRLSTPPTDSENPY